MSYLNGDVPLPALPGLLPGRRDLRTPVELPRVAAVILATSSSSRRNSSSVLDAAAVPSDASGGAIEDLGVQLRYWGKSHLDAEAFNIPR